MANGDDLCYLPAANGYGDNNNTRAAPVLRNQHILAAFDDTTSEYWIFEGFMPSWYDGGNIGVTLHWIAATATSGDVVWAVAWERIQAGTTDIDSDSFASETQNTSTADTTSGETSQFTATFTQATADGIDAGEPFRLRVRRNPGHASDNMTGDAQILFVVIDEVT